MKQISQYRYEVKNSEVITFEITPVGVGQRVTASQNGQTINNSGTPDQPIFQFTVTEDAGNSHFAKFEFSFIDSDPDHAKFEIKIRGSNEEEFDIRPVEKTNNRWEKTFEFSVVE